jgi:hypothetical protein
MYIYGVSKSDLESVLCDVSLTMFYNGNLQFKRIDERKTHCVVTLRVRDSAGPGARTSREGRRMASACWHAHRDFLSTLFARFPHARVKSAMADYRGADDFQEKFDNTGSHNAGSMACPVSYRNLCHC